MIVIFPAIKFQPKSGPCFGSRLVLGEREGTVTTLSHEEFPEGRRHILDMLALEAYAAGQVQSEIGDTSGLRLRFLAPLPYWILTDGWEYHARIDVAPLKLASELLFGEACIFTNQDTGHPANAACPRCFLVQFNKPAIAQIGFVPRKDASFGFDQLIHPL